MTILEGLFLIAGCLVIVASLTIIFESIFMRPNRD